MAYTCCFCQHRSCSFIRNQEHEDAHTGTRRYTCQEPGCHFAATKQTNLARHVRQTHERHKPFVCQTCGRTSSSRFNMETHMKSHSTVRPFACAEVLPNGAVCAYAAKLAKTLATHKLIHAAPQHVCTIAGCSYATRKQSDMVKHLQKKH